MGNKKTPPTIRFWSKVEKTDNCWNWIAGIFSNGYGQFFNGINKICAHRFSYEEYYGKVPNGLLLCHKCDNRKCVNPDHLFLGTQKDNIRDMYQKNRNKNGDLKGEKNGRALITESEVIKMRELFNLNNSITEIARNFNVSETQTSRIVKFQSWKHIK